MEDNSLNFNYSSLLDSVEKDFKLTVNLTDRFKYSVSSGLLVNDLLLGGGMIVGGMYTIAGMEQTAKSTSIMAFLAKHLGSKEIAKMVTYFDAEGSFDPRYFREMLSVGLSDTEIFGLKDTSGKYKVPPKVRYYPENRGEMVLDSINSMLKRMPDKELLGENWFFTFDNTKANQKALSGKYSKALFKKYNRFYVESGGPSPQAIIVVDSWPALITERSDDDDLKDGLGANARMFSSHLPKIKGKLRRKGAILLGINQLREKPMAYGDPRYEPGGNALKFYSDVRVWHTGRANPNGGGQFEKEEGISGGEDTYRYITAKTIKNKLSTPYLEGWHRLWVSDAEGKAHGFDPVWDTYSYLKMTGQLVDDRGKITCDLIKTNKVIRWSDFKTLIIGSKKQVKEVSTKLGIEGDSIKMRKECFKQISSGDGVLKYFKTLKNAIDSEDSEDE